ncbi:FMN-dependent NADH-azoreductase [Variovorax sp. HW608]|uniref:FMN-dependent NADH-azoreductase n=1 Tax=Variovorax sp. HW608 TaxID=1034889 RepID=UPI0008201B3D|nr:FMN-dependent NADH-azoreductase [Variovorax sp. HW608]SCK14675.1 FMN-dependent NADH-azoreductase [Variovorax sp. HW608]
MKLLHIDSSISGAQSASRQLTAGIVSAWKKANPSVQVTYHDLAADPVGHLTGAEFAVLRGAQPQDAVKEDADRNARLLDDFLGADVVVVGAPMYNFSLPTQLKAWLDRLAVPGRTFRYSDNGVEGLVTGKRVIIASSRGGFYSEGHPAAFLDHQESYLKGMFGFVGVKEIEFVRAEGLGISPDVRKAALEAAAAQIEQLPA